MAVLLADMASAAEAATVTATWNKNPESDVTGYKLSYGTASGSYTTTVDVGNVTTWVITTLTAGQRYYFVAQAYNSGGLLSANSVEAFFDVPATTLPAITTLSPASGPVATTVTITGANFGATSGTSTVTFNGTAATPSTWGATSIVVQAPAGVTTGLVVVTVGGNVSNGVVFTLNRPPTLAAVANQSNAENALVSLQLAGSDPDGAAVTYTATNLPGGLILPSASGVISGTLTYTSAGSYSVVVTASDGTLTASQTFTWTVTDVNRPPTLVAVADQTSTPNVNASLQLAGSDPDGTVVSYGAAGLPNGVTVDAATGLIFGAAATGSDGLYPVTATVSDGMLTASRTFTWTVAAAVVPTSPVMDVAVWADGATARTTIVSPGFSTTIGNELVLAFVATDYGSGANTTVTGVTGAGLTWALVGRTNAQAGTSEIWRAFAPAPLTGVTVTATLSQAVSSLLTVISFSNVDWSGTNGSGAIGATATANRATGPPTATLVTTRNNVWVVGVGNDFDNAIARTVGSGQTLVHQFLASVGDTYWVQRRTGPTSLAGTSVTIDDTAPITDRSNLFLVEIRPPATVDTAAPTVSLTAPADGAMVTGPAVTISATAADAVAVAGVQFKLDGVNLGAEVAVSPYAVAWNTTAALNGGHALTALARDSSGNTTLSVVVNVTVANAALDTTPPTVALIAPSAGTSVAGSAVTVSAVASDNVGVFGVQFLLDGAALGGEARAAPYALTWSTTSVPNGLHTLSARARDAANNTTTSPSVGVRVSNPVILTWNAPAPIVYGTALSATQLNATASVPGTFVYTPPAGTVLVAGAGQVLAVTFTPTDTVNYAQAAASVTITVGAATASPTIDAVVSTDGGTARTTVVSPGFSTATGNELVLAFVATDYVSGANTTVTGVTGAGLTWALVGRTNAQAGTSEIWRAFASAPLTGVTVTATISQAVASLLTVMSFSNVDSSGTNGSGAIGATATASLASGAPTATLVTTRDNAWVIGVGNDFDRPIARTVGAGQTLVHQYLPPVGDTYWVQRLLAPTRLAGTSVTLTDTAPTTDRFNLFVVEIRPPAAAATTTLTVSPIALAAEATAMDVMAATSTSDALRSTDYNGDGRSDLAVQNPLTGRWSILLSGTNYRDSMSIMPGISGDIPVPGDYDGDGKTDVAVYRPSTGIWYVLPSSTNYTGRLSSSLGEAGDVPVPGDYDGDGKTDFAVFRPTTHEWVVLLSSTGALTINSWGASGDVAVPGDYDGDHKTDIAVYTPWTGVWSILTSATQFASSMTLVLGAGTDIPVPADYDGDAATDVAVYRPSSGTWYMLQSHTGNTEVVGLTLGGGADVPVPGDYDGDGKADVAIYETSTGVWQIVKSSDGKKMTGSWGTSSDVALPRNRF